MVKIEISNRTMYFLVTFGIIALFAVGVFAYTTDGSGTPSVMGHSVEELEGVCQSDGTSCFVPIDFQENLRLYINPSDQLCFPTSDTISCTTQTSTCTAQATFSIASGGLCDSSNRDALCQMACEATAACDGDLTLFSCGATSVFYDQFGTDPCSGSTFACYCSLSSGNQAYQKEIPSNARCL